MVIKTVMTITALDTMDDMKEGKKKSSLGPRLLVVFALVFDACDLRNRNSLWSFTHWALLYASHFLGNWRHFGQQKQYPFFKWRLHCSGGNKQIRNKKYIVR